MCPLVGLLFPRIENQPAAPRLPAARGSAPGARGLNLIAGGWRVGGVYVAQSGTPVAITGASSKALNGRPLLVPGVPLEVSRELRR